MKKAITTIAILFALLIAIQPIVHAETLNLIYDANGNLVTGDGFFREYNSLNQLVRVRNNTVDGTILQEYVHDPVAEKIVIKKTFNATGSVVETVYYFSEDYVRTDYHNGTVVNCEYIYLEGQQVAQSCNDVVKFIHGDHLGSASVVTDTNGDVLENTTYTPYGEIVEGGSGRYDYEGKEFDSLTEDYDFHFRKYDPSTGLFSQPDTLIQNIYDPQSLNRYMFERGNPYSYMDEDGHIAVASLITITLVSIAVVSASIFFIDSGQYASKVWRGEATARDATEYYSKAVLAIAGAWVSYVKGAVLATIGLFKPEEKLSDKIFGEEEEGNDEESQSWINEEKVWNTVEYDNAQNPTTLNPQDPTTTKQKNSGGSKISSFMSAFWQKAWKFARQLEEGYKNYQKKYNSENDNP
ncbi:MAG: hypothetical protein KKF44_06610 [Nanoarchaeota archaeon]|nr:hypothetical protein [Nanoarchaeota archaeon]